MSRFTERQRQKIQQMCQRIWARIGEDAPEGLGRWLPAWRYVDSFDKTFEKAVVAYTLKPTKKNYQRLEAAGVALLDAWKTAAEVWEEEGFPQDFNTPEQRSGMERETRKRRRR